MFVFVLSGPRVWAATYPQSCNGTKQSPIDIGSSQTTYDSALGDLTFTNYDTVPAGAKVKVGNNGHSYRVLFKPNEFLVSGGGLPGTFYTHGFHFHWGSDNTKGSEHTVNGKKYPAEVSQFLFI
jgi:carbonic anhydrase